MYRQQEPEINLEQLLSRFKGLFGRFGGKGKGIAPLIVVVIFAVVLLLWLASGIFTVQPGEQAALRLFGKYTEAKDSGLHWWWPGPIGAKDLVRVDEVRRLELGVRGDTVILSESLMITGDPDESGMPGEAPNIVDAQLLVQYDIKDIGDFLFKVVSPEVVTLKDAAETSMRQVVGSRPIDDVLTDKKEDVQIEVKQKLQAILDEYNSGIRVREVKLLNVFAPEQVKDAFDDVVRAKEDKARIINLADAYKEDVLPKARGEAARRLQAAEGYRQQKIAVATGESEKFIAIQEEYSHSQDITRKRLYLEAMEKILPNMTKILGDPGEVILVHPEGKDLLPFPLPSSD